LNDSNTRHQVKDNVYMIMLMMRDVLAWD